MTIYPKNTSTVFSYFLQGKEIADLTLLTINSLRSECVFEFLWQKTVQQAEVLEITQLSLPHKRKRPVKLLKQNEATLYDEVSGIYFDAIDTVANCIKTRFSQPGYRAIKNIGQRILNELIGLEYKNQLRDALFEYGEEINH